MLLGWTAVELEIGAGPCTSGLEDTDVLNTANGQTAGLDRVVVVAENRKVAGVAAATAVSPEVVGTLTDAHIATVICVSSKKNLREVNRAPNPVGSLDNLPYLVLIDLYQLSRYSTSTLDNYAALSSQSLFFMSVFLYVLNLDLLL